MPRPKKTTSKKEKPKKADPEKDEEEHEEDMPEEEEPEGDAEETFGAKEKAPIIEIEERDDIVTPIDKLVADPLLEASSIEGADEDLIDEEEYDPFGDK